jgi:hypothetical protein
MVEPPVFKDAVQRMDAAPFRVVGAEDDRCEPGMDDSAGAHDAGFQRDVQGGADEAVVPHPLRRPPYGKDLRVGSRVARGGRPVVGRGDDVPSPDDERADGHFTLPARRFRFRQGKPHEPYMLFRHAAPQNTRALARCMHQSSR